LKKYELTLTNRVSELFTGEAAFSDKPEFHLSSHFSEAIKKGVRPLLPKDFILEPLVQRMWDADPLKRPSFSDIYIEISTLEKDIETISDPDKEILNFFPSV
jgi:hypothetical protein